MQTQTVPEASAGFPHFAPGEHRALLAELHRWLRTRGYANTYRGWINERHIADAAVAVMPDTPSGAFDVTERKADGTWHRPASYAAVDAGQAVDLLVALRILPVAFSSAYRAGRKDGDWIHNVDSNPARRCRFCGASSGLTPVYGPFGVREGWQCWDECKDSAR